METDNEIWKHVKNFEPRYRISSHGRLLSIGGKYGGECIMKPHIGMQGYYNATLRMKPLKRKVRIHTLVAEHFIGEKPPGKRMTVNHKDGNKLNNHVSNLEWIEARDNTMHAAKMGLMAKGERHAHAKLTVEKVLEMRKLHAETGMYFKHIADKFGVSRCQARDVIRGVNWGWLKSA